MASIARIGMLRRRHRLVPVPIDPMTLRIREIQKTILNMQQQYECPVCLELISDPHASECGHYFCKDCILQHITISSKKSHPKCPLCKEPVTKRSLVENSNMGDISKAIRQLTEGFQLDTGSSVTTPYVGGADNNIMQTTNEISESTDAPKEMENENNETQEKVEPVVVDSSDLCRPLSHLDVTDATRQTKTETKEALESATLPGIGTKEKESMDSNTAETKLEKEIQGSHLAPQSLDLNRCKGFGLGKSRIPMQKSKKRNITNIISEILGFSEETSGPIPTFNDFNQSNGRMKPFRSANLGANTGECGNNMELSTGTMNSGFSCAKVLLDSAKLAQNGTETKKKPLETPNLEPTEGFRSKRLKSETESKAFSFVSGANLLGMCHDQESEQTGTNTIPGSESSRHVAPDLYPFTAETFSGIGDFSPVKFSPQKIAPTFNQTYDVLPLSESETRTGTILSSTMRPEISTNQKLEEAFTGEDILNLTFSDISLLSQSNEAMVETGTNDEITLTQFLTQYPRNATPHLATENMHHLCQNRNQLIAIPELSSKRSNQFPNENFISLETSKNVTTYNQTRFELELQDLISENETETMDSVHFPLPPVHAVQSANQNSPEGTQYSNLDIFTPLQDKDTFSPKVSDLELTLLETRFDQEHSEILANESLTNFDESHHSFSFRSELRVIPATPSTRDASQSPTLVAEETPSTITNQNGTNRSFDFSHLTDIIYSGTNNPVGCSSAPLECHTSLFTPKANT